MKTIVIDFVVLIYGKIYYDMLRLKQDRELARFSALMQSSLLFTFNLFVIINLAEVPFGTRSTQPTFWHENGSLIIKGVLFLSIAVSFYILRRLMAEFGSKYDDLLGDESALTLRVAARCYPYFVFILLILSIIVYANF